MNEYAVTCSVRVFDGSRDVSGHICGRPVKSEGLCAVHLAGRARAERNARVRQAARNESNRRHEEAKTACGRLNDLGVEAAPEYMDYLTKRDGLHGAYTGGVVIRAEDVEKIITALEDWRRADA